MSQVIPLFPTFNEDVKDDIFSLNDYTFFYQRDNKTIRLDSKKDDTGLCVEATLSDEIGFWNPDEYPLCVTRNINVVNVSQLFGSENPSEESPYAIACHDAVIGIALKWYSADSNQSRAIPVGEFNKSSQGLKFCINHVFDKASIRGIVYLKIILYVSKSGKSNMFEKHLGNTPGMILGELDTFAIRIDGNGSSFPIYEVEEPNEPLWDVRCTWTDPDTDSFSDCVSIYINKAHKNYMYLNREDSRNFSAQLFAEIMSSAICVIIETLRAEKLDLEKQENAQEGSVLQAVKYFREKLGWDLKTAQDTSKSIRLFLEDKLKKL